MNIFRLHISARTRRQETLPAELAPQPAPAPRRQVTPALGQVPVCDCLGACDCAKINDLRRYLPHGTIDVKKSVAEPDSVAQFESSFQICQMLYGLPEKYSNK